MTSPLPTHLSIAIRQHIAVLREVWRVDEVCAQIQPQLDYPATRLRPERRPDPGATSRTFPGRHRDPEGSTS
jgi:hypothetical protein